jgi:hypothetical protein
LEQSPAAKLNELAQKLERENAERKAAAALKPAVRCFRSAWLCCVVDFRLCAWLCDVASEQPASFVRFCLCFAWCGVPVAQVSQQGAGQGRQTQADVGS